jgi:uncharacterized membrane protein YphA (DoxX/SURF4 family)
MFAPGWPGIGLLVLRIALGVPLLVEGGALLADWRGTTGLLIVGALISATAGFALQLGHSARRGAIAGAMTVIALHFSWPHGEHLNLFSSKIACFLAVSIAIALVFLGPGAFSIDARRFGRREIVIPPRPTPH